LNVEAPTPGRKGFPVSVKATAEVRVKRDVLDGVESVFASTQV